VPLWQKNKRYVSGLSSVQKRIPLRLKGSQRRAFLIADGLHWHSGAQSGLIMPRNIEGVNSGVLIFLFIPQQYFTPKYAIAKLKMCNYVSNREFRRFN